VNLNATMSKRGASQTNEAEVLHQLSKLVDDLLADVIDAIGESNSQVLR
jgi:hypothetical protein